MNQDTTESPLWDVAIESLLREQHLQRAEALRLGQLRDIAEHHRIRLDDILETLCKLVQHGEWRYRCAGETIQSMDRDMCRLLHANHRLNLAQIERFDGFWSPT